MTAFIPMLKNVILFVLLAIPGFLMVKCKLLKQEQSGILSKLLMYVGLPFMIFSGTLGIKFDSQIIINLIIESGWVCGANKLNGICIICKDRKHNFFFTNVANVICVSIGAIG